jgi:hypothetical protein
VFWIGTELRTTLTNQIFNHEANKSRLNSVNAGFDSVRKVFFSVWYLRNMGTGSLPGVKRPERGVNDPPPSSAGVHCG